MLRLHNEQRQWPLSLNDRLMRAARDHAEWMDRNNIMSHTGAGGSDPKQRIVAAGYEGSAWGENVATGSDAHDVFRRWMNSFGHRRNIQNPAYDEFGFWVTGRHWCTCFGRAGMPSFAVGEMDTWDESQAAPNFEDEENTA